MGREYRAGSRAHTHIRGRDAPPPVPAIESLSNCWDVRHRSVHRCAQELLQKDLRLLGIQSESERAVRQLREKRNTSGTACRVSGNTAAKTESTLSDPDSLELQASLPDPFAGLGALGSGNPNPRARRALLLPD
jgi:hypothetical protein